MSFLKSENDKIWFTIRSNWDQLPIFSLYFDCLYLQFMLDVRSMWEEIWGACDCSDTILKNIMVCNKLIKYVGAGTHLNLTWSSSFTGYYFYHHYLLCTALTITTTKMKQHFLNNWDSCNVFTDYAHLIIGLKDTNKRKILRWSWLDSFCFLKGTRQVVEWNVHGVIAIFNCSCSHTSRQIILIVWQHSRVQIISQIDSIISKQILFYIQVKS